MTSPGDTLAIYAPLVPRMLAMASTVMTRAERNNSAEDLATVAQVVTAAATWSREVRVHVDEPAETHPGLILRRQMQDNTGRRRRTA